MDRVERQKKLFDLPDTVIPHSVIALGWPAVGGDVNPMANAGQKKGYYEPDRIHTDHW